MSTAIYLTFIMRYCSDWWLHEVPRIMNRGEKISQKKRIHFNTHIISCFNILPEQSRNSYEKKIPLNSICARTIVPDVRIWGCPHTHISQIILWRNTSKYYSAIAFLLCLRVEPGESRKILKDCVPLSVFLERFTFYWTFLPTAKFLWKKQIRNFRLQFSLTIETF